MYIVIAGAGLLGRGLAKRLVENKHDVVVVDIDEEACDKVYREYGAVSVHGDATSVDVLEDAGLDDALSVRSPVDDEVPVLPEADDGVCDPVALPVDRGDRRACLAVVGLQVIDVRERRALDRRDARPARARLGAGRPGPRRTGGLAAALRRRPAGALARGSRGGRNGAQKGRHRTGAIGGLTCCR